MPDNTHMDELTKTLSNFGKHAKRFKWIAYGIATVIFIFVVIKIVAMIGHWKDMGWSLKNDTTEIALDSPEYEAAMDSWAEMDYANSEALFLTALEASNSKNGEGSLESAAIGQKLGALYLEMGNYNEAYERLNNAYVSFQKDLGDGDGNTIIARGQVAIYDIKMGNFERGFAALNDLYDNATYFWHKIQIAQMLAQCNTWLGNYKKAIEWYDVLGSLYYQFEIKNLSRVTLLNDYGVLMITVGNYQEAVNSLSSAVATWTELGISEDATIATVYSNLAQAYAWCGNQVQAIDASEKALAIQKRLFGDRSIHVAMSYELLSDMYDALGNNTAQKEFLETALEIASDTVGENHMCTATIYLALGNYYSQIQDMEHAVQCHQKSLEIRKNILGTSNVNTIVVYEALANDYRELNELGVGIENADYAIGIAEDLYGRENLYSAHSYITAAWLFADAGNFEKASRLATTAVEICDRQKNNAGLTRPYAYQTVGYVNLKNDDFSEAIKYFKKAHMLYKDTEIDTTEEIANTLILLSEAYMLAEDAENCLYSLIDANELLIEKPEWQALADSASVKLHEIFEQQNPGCEFSAWYEQKKAERAEAEGAEGK